jgi:hypothetical protein
VWETKQERICDTLEWFPAKVTMPLASSMDLVMAGVRVIIHALRHLAANSPIAPPTDSKVAVLNNLTNLLLKRNTKLDRILLQPPVSPSRPPLTLNQLQG